MADIVLNTGDTAWVLASTALVLLMTPGLALFYGGMVRAKSVLNMMLMSMVTIGIVSVLWVIYGLQGAERLQRLRQRRLGRWWFAEQQDGRLEGQVNVHVRPS
jgi:ammonia channel protein AmtB